MNRLLAIIALCLCGLPAWAEPGRHWRSIDPISAGWSQTTLQVLQDYAELRRPTALMLMQNGAVLASFGEAGLESGPVGEVPEEGELRVRLAREDRLEIELDVREAGERGVVTQYP